MLNKTPRHEAIVAAAGKLINSAREREGKTQPEIAKLFDIKRDAVSKWENGSTDISLYQFLVTCEYLASSLPANHPALALIRELAPRAPKKG